MASASAARLWIELVQRPRHLNPAGRSAQEDDPFLDLWRRTPKAFTASAIKRAVRGRLIIEYPCGKCGREATADKEFAEYPMPEGILRNAGQAPRTSNERYEDGRQLASTTKPTDAPLFDYNIRGDRVPQRLTLPSVAFTIGKAPASK